MPRPQRDTPNITLFTRGSRYHIKWWDNGAWRRLPTGTSDKPTAEKLLAQFIAGTYDPAPPPAPTIEAILDGYLGDRKGKISTHDDATANAAHLKRHLGPLEPGHLTVTIARKYARDRFREGQTRGPEGAPTRKDISPSTVRREVAILRAALKWAVDANWIVKAPAFEAPEPARPRQRWMTHHEAEQLMEHATAPHIRTYIALALNTGARTGAILELTWDMVDLHARRISFGTGSGNKRRAVHIPINNKLLDQLRIAKATATSPFVVEYGGGQVKSIKTGFTATCRRAGLKGVTPHVCRHTAASWMVMAGVSFEKVGAMLGNSAKMIRDVYGHFAPDWLVEAANALENRNIITGPIGPVMVPKGPFWAGNDENGPKKNK